jgi:tRNA pseudouridine55 synthase
MENIFAIYKPKGPSSYSIVSKVKKASGNSKVGHAGTLDPLASGVLVVGVGREATRQLTSMVAAEKEYLADITLGVVSTTDDDEGKKSFSDIKKKPSSTDVRRVVKQFVGDISQTPPIYSAIKVSGKRAYKYAREGSDLELKPRLVYVKKIKILKYKFPHLRIRVICGKGVYIRSLARDIGSALGTGGYMSDLERTRVGRYRKNRSMSIEALGKYYFNRLIKNINKCQIGVMPTDTIYGLVGKAMDKKVVERIYKVRLRQPDKPFIILISQLADIKRFGINIDDKIKEAATKYWPGQVSMVLSGASDKFEYLHRGSGSLAFRLPAHEKLLQLLKKTGPLIATSANTEGRKPASTIRAAKKYFNNSIDFYVDFGKLEASPSTLIAVTDQGVELIRQGVVKLK